MNNPITKDTNMTITKITAIPVRDMLAGDKLVDRRGETVWTAWDDARWSGKIVTIRVQLPDGGVEARIWGNPDETLSVVRAA